MRWPLGADGLLADPLRLWWPPSRPSVAALPRRCCCDTRYTARSGGARQVTVGEAIAENARLFDFELREALRCAR